jgi:hypothetical protein
MLANLWRYSSLSLPFESIKQGLGHGAIPFDLLLGKAPSSFDLKIITYMEKFNMRLCALLVSKGYMTKKEAIIIFAETLRDIGESDDHIRDSVAELKKVFGLGSNYTQIQR